MIQNIFGQQEQKEVEIQRLTNTPTIDGNIGANEYADMAVLDNFVQFMPYNGQAPTKRSIAWVGYDDQAFYVAAKFYDELPDNIPRIISERDDIDMGLNDLISLVLSPYDDQNNALSFVVTATGAQLDRKCMPDGIDVNWDAVWESATKIDEDGWSVELKVPYSALRIPRSEIQNWGFNIWRKDSNNSEWSTWSYADNEKGEFFNYYGMLNGFKDIKPPVRLSLMPYVSTYFDKYGDNKGKASFNAGLDLKYGINESFTLDAILIPDFGQVQSDDQQLNLSPYEIRFDEKRQFFTEGMELFNKGNLFYSRRIGSRPVDYSNVSSQLEDGEEITKNPIESKLLNAFKISGRTDKGLGIGFFNAMTSKSNALITNTEDNSTRELETQGFTNYNMFVVDQLLSKNSYISLVNTNVNRKDFMANVTATELRLADKGNNYALKLKGGLSYRDLNDESETGYTLDLNLAKLSGNFKYSYSLGVIDDKYNPNDMGYLRMNNQLTNRLRFDYNIYKPFGKFLNMTNYISFDYTRLYKPGAYSDFTISYEWSALLKNQTYLQMHALWRPKEQVDHFESRVAGRALNLSKGFHNCFTYRTDSRKTLSVMIHGGFYFSNNFITDHHNYSIMAIPTFKINNRTYIEWNTRFGINNNEIGFVNMIEDDIFMGERNTAIFENSISFKYMANADLSFSLRARHYWAEAIYDNYYSLLENGDLQLESGYEGNHDINYNALTIDATVSWNFLPGSVMSLAWKNSIYTSNKDINRSYFQNLSDLMKAPHQNSLSIKVLYYLDYHSFKKNK